jgi:ATP adenylyltransferase
VEQLWAPWRLAYVANPKHRAPGDDCFICAALAGSDDRSSFIIHRSALSSVMLNRFPYNNGHLLIASKAHKATPADLSDAETLDLQHLLQKMLAILQKTMNPEGFNVGLNLGRVAGAGLPGHLHWHVVPRWNGDTNFMPVVSDTRVIVQSLEACYDLLKKELDS